MTARLSPEDLEQLVWSLGASDGFSLFFVASAGAASTETVLRQIRRESALPISSVRLRPETPITQQLENFVMTDASGATAIAVVGVDALMSASDPKASSLVSQELNWKRNALVRTNRSFIFFVSNDALNQLAISAPDFFDYRSGVFTALLSPDPRFWLFDRISPAPDIVKRAESQVAFAEERLSKERDSSLTGRMLFLDDLLAVIRACLTLGKLSQAKKYLLDLDSNIENLGDVAKPAQFRGEMLKAQILSAEGRYEEARDSFLVLLDTIRSGSPGEQVVQRDLNYHICKAEWYMATDDQQVLDRLMSAPNPTYDPRTDQLQAMILETLSLPGSEVILQNQSRTLSSADHPALRASSGYHFARYRLTVGDLLSARSEIDRVSAETSERFGPRHDSVGFINLLDARCRLMSRESRVTQLVQGGLKVIVQSHGISSDATLDAIVQIREMGLQPLQIGRAILSPEEYAQAEKTWAVRETNRKA